MSEGSFPTPKKNIRVAFPPGHYYSPIVDPAQAERFLKKVDFNIHSLPGIEIDERGMLDLWRSFSNLLSSQPFPDDREQGHLYWFNNPAFSYGDGTLLYCMLRRFSPRRLVEIGSGYSSACMIETAEKFFNVPSAFTFIEPNPELLRSLISGDDSQQEVELIAREVQATPLSLFSSLNRDDFLFIDSTHVLKTGSDVCFILFDILPLLKPGVIIHFHDIFWPFEYGPEWVVDENRSWNELYALRAFLSYNKEFEVLFFSDYFRRFYAEELTRLVPWVAKNSGGSIWLRRR